MTVDWTFYIMHVPYLPEYIQTCTDREQHEKLEKAKVRSVPGSPTSSEGSKGRGYRTLGLITGSMHHGKLPHHLPLVPPIPCPNLQDLAQHLRQHCTLYEVISMLVRGSTKTRQLHMVPKGLQNIYKPRV